MIVNMLCRAVKEKSYLANEVFGEIAEVVGPWNVRVGEQVLLLIFWLVTITQEELEQMEQPDPIQALYSTLNVKMSMQLQKLIMDAYGHKGLSSFTAYSEEVVADQHSLGKSTGHDGSG